MSTTELEAKKNVAIKTQGEYSPISLPAVETALLTGDLSKLNEEQRMSYYYAVCNSLGLNALTKPFEYLSLNGKTIMYAKKDCTDQLRSIHKVSCRFVKMELLGTILIYRYELSTADGRRDEAIGTINIDGLEGKSLADAHMKAETRAKRRGTLSICGLGFPDESEVLGDDPHIDVARVQNAAPLELRGEAPLSPQGEIAQEQIGYEPEPMATEEQMQHISDLLECSVWSDAERQQARNSMQGGLTEAKAKEWVQKLTSIVNKRVAAKQEAI